MPHKPNDPLDDSVLHEAVDLDSGLNPERTAHVSAHAKESGERDASGSRPLQEVSGGLFEKLRSVFGALFRS